MIRRMQSDASRRGFTLLELMTVVTVIGILAAIMSPRFAVVLRKSHDGATKGNLGILRGAVGVYFGDQDGRYPSDLAALTASGRYLTSLPKSKARNYHNDTAAVRQESGVLAITDAGGWSYDNAQNDANFGSVWVHCTHTDSLGRAWTEY